MGGKWDDFYEVAKVEKMYGRALVGPRRNLTKKD
jgi:hypothetical protein